MTERITESSSSVERVASYLSQNQLDRISSVKLAVLLGADTPLVARVVNKYEIQEGVQIKPRRRNRLGKDDALKIAGWMDDYRANTGSGK